MKLLAYREVVSMGKTSWQVKQKYNQKAYTRIVADVPKELATAFKTKCKEKNISQAQIIKKAVENFINEN